MTTSAITFFKTVSAPPAGPTYVQNACYFVRVGSGFDVYVTNSDGTAIWKQNDDTGGGGGGSTFTDKVLDSDLIVDSTAVKTDLMSLTLTTEGRWLIHGTIIVDSIGNTTDIKPTIEFNSNLDVSKLYFVGAPAGDTTPHQANQLTRQVEEGVALGVSGLAVLAQLIGIVVTTGADQVINWQAQKATSGSDLNVRKYSWLSARYMGVDI